MTRAVAQGPTGPSGADAVGCRCVANLCITWIILMALLYVSPALGKRRPPTFGPPIGGALSVLTQHGKGGAPVHDVGNGDDIDRAWPGTPSTGALVHDGELPLWNDCRERTAPAADDFQSAALALPTLVGYLFRSLSFLVTVVMKLLIAGTGAYVLTRLLGGRALAGAMAGTTFMLCGSSPVGSAGPRPGRWPSTACDRRRRPCSSSEPDPGAGRPRWLFSRSVSPLASTGVSPRLTRW